MADKIAPFLRVLGSGLSPQAFQANVSQFHAEQADERLMQREARSDEREIKKISAEQAFTNLGFLGVAAKEATANGNTKLAHKIGLAVKDITDRFPNYAQSMQDTFLSYTLGEEEDKTEKAGKAYVLPNGDHVTAFQKNRQFMYRDRSGQLVNLPYGSKPAPTRQVVGKPGSFGLSPSGENTTELTSIEAEQNVHNNVRNIESLMKTFSSPDYLGGVTGDAIQLLNSARAQVVQLFGGENYLDENGNINPKAFRSDSKYRRMAINGSLAESQTMELAFILAKALNSDGRISDADVRNATKILGDSADPKVRFALLRKVQERIVGRYNSDQSVVWRRDKNKNKKPLIRLKLSDMIGSTTNVGARDQIKNKFDALFESNK